MNPIAQLLSFTRNRRAPRSLQQACTNLQNNAAVVLQATATAAMAVIGIVVGTQMQEYSTPCLPSSSSPTPSPTRILPAVYQSLSKSVSAASVVLLVISLGNTLKLCSSQLPGTPSRKKKIKKCLEILSVVFQVSGATTAITSTALGCSCFDGNPSPNYYLAGPFSITGGVLHSLQALTLLASSLLEEEESSPLDIPLDPVKTSPIKPKKLVIISYETVV
ncbi:hypothetical protein CLAVI_000256 [Candidatus Clavichlamydia salmonicola]|uniref:hypothetical protein n=1 Tax=Candidatus Clavichlamydia salmonicola TaxID=469812 RepID=UPI001890C826|nr:hypothetical protein [Candidatus Clavichlamydia salmonicola]MBF5050642.1 hypothetical protein [Candidatus Clavichlamydia salmonicola]